MQCFLKIKINAKKKNWINKISEFKDQISVSGHTIYLHILTHSAIWSRNRLCPLIKLKHFPLTISCQNFCLRWGDHLRELVSQPWPTGNRVWQLRRPCPCLGFPVCPSPSHVGHFWEVHRWWVVSITAETLVQIMQISKRNGESAWSICPWLPTQAPITVSRAFTGMTSK